MPSIYDFTVTDADGQAVPVASFEGKVLLIVNVASKCGYTPQYEGLETLFRDERQRGLQLLGFPCDQFGNQEPGTDAEIQEFCSLNYGVTFPVMHKIEVNGPDADPMYAYLRAEAPGDFSDAPDRLAAHIGKTRPEALGTDEIKWNFTKFLVDRDGRVVRRYESYVTPDAIRPDIDTLL